MIKVTNIPNGTSKEALLLFFENRRRRGGGPVNDLEYDPDTRSAVVTFEEPEGKILYIWVARYGLTVYEVTYFKMFQLDSLVSYVYICFIKSCFLYDTSGFTCLILISLNNTVFDIFVIKYNM